MGVITYIGRSLLLAVLVAQVSVFSHYASLFYGDDNLHALIVLVAVTLLIWPLIIKKCRKQLNWQWLVWLVYAITLLIPMIILLFRVEFTKKLDPNNFFGPNFLKIITCGAPAIALLLLTTAKDSQNYEGSVAQLCGSIALDSFDELELLEMLLDRELASEFSIHIEGSIIAFVCISFLVTALEMAEYKFDGNNMELRDERLYIARLCLQLLFVNIPLLTIRLVVWRKYHHDASIFIAKNVIIICTSLMEIIRVKCT